MSNVTNAVTKGKVYMQYNLMVNLSSVNVKNMILEKYRQMDRLIMLVVMFFALHFHIMYLSW